MKRGFKTTTLLYKKNLDSLLWSDVRNAKYFPDAKVVTQRPNYEVTVSILDAPTLEKRMHEAGISTARFVHDNGSVTFSFSENDRDMVDNMVTDLRLVDARGRKMEPVKLRQIVIDLTPRTDVSSRTPEENISPPEPQSRNFQITDDHLGEDSAKTKFKNNVTAIQTLQEIEFDERSATPEEQEILSRYVGWGSLPQAFDEKNEAWTDEFQELYALLSPQEYAAARATTLNAHYTSPTVIKSMYQAIENMGFRTGNILEPSCGIGNFFGLIPDRMKESKLYGVEIDGLSGRIARKLYPDAEITIAGFETTNRREFYDLAVGNVPFGNYTVADRPYDKLGLSIHNYFFVKALDQVRAGGIVAFVTSRFTMDAKSVQARKQIAQRAELIGAIRLPNNAFKANAGTEVVTDILFLQKREQPMLQEPHWVNLGETPDGILVNQYFVEHPEMVLGEFSRINGMYGKEELTVLPIEGRSLSEQLQEAISHIHGTYREIEHPKLEPEESQDSILANPDVKNFSYTVVDGNVYYRENEVMNLVDLPQVSLERVKGMVAIRDAAYDLIHTQMETSGDSALTEKQAELSRLYDAFRQKYGILNHSANRRVFKNDSGYFLLCSLEVLNREDGTLERKADIFTKRTINRYEPVTHVDTSQEALAVSMSEKAKVDLDIRKKLIEKGVPKEEIAFIHDADTEAPKTELFAKVRAGRVRFLLGSTSKMGAGTNIQRKLIALHHIDVPWRPSDVGRILRTFKIKECGGNRQWQRRFLRNWAANTSGKAIT